MDAGATGAVASGNTGQEATTKWEANNPDPQGLSRIKQGPWQQHQKVNGELLMTVDWSFLTVPSLRCFAQKRRKMQIWCH